MRGMFAHPHLAADKSKADALLRVTELARVTKLGLNSGLLILKLRSFPYNRGAPFTGLEMTQVW